MRLKLKIPPVAQGVIVLVFIWLLNRYLPLYRLSFTYQGFAAGALIGIGVIVGTAAVMAFIKLRTTIDPRYPDRAGRLVVTGVFRYSRNPMYLAILLVLTGVSVNLGALSNFFTLLSFVIFINRYQIVPEESALRDKFGESYKAYTRSVRRWF